MFSFKMTILDMNPLYLGGLGSRLRINLEPDVDIPMRLIWIALPETYNEDWVANESQAVNSEYLKVKMLNIRLGIARLL